MADVIITTDTAELFSHDVYFTFTLQDSAMATHSARLFDLGKIKYEFDIPDSGEETNAIGVKAGALKVELENIFTDSSATFIDTLRSAYEHDLTQTWSANFYWRDRGGTYGNPLKLEFTYSDVDYDYEDDLLKLELQPIVETNTTVGDIVDNFDPSTEPVYTFDYNNVETGITGGDSLTAKVFIESCLKTLYGGSSVILDTDLVDTTTAGDRTWFVVDQSDEVPSKERSALSMLTLIATLEGAITGSGLGTGFYVSRYKTSNTVEINWDDVTKYKRQQFSNTPYRQVFVKQTIGDLSENEFSKYYKNAEKILNIVFAGDGYLYGEILDPETDATYPVRYEQNDGTDTNLNNIISRGVTNYSKAFGFSGEEVLEIEAWGITGIYPYSVLQFSSSAPDFIELKADGVTKKNYRIKKIEYDFKQDSFKASVYEI